MSVRGGEGLPAGLTGQAQVDSFRAAELPDIHFCSSLVDCLTLKKFWGAELRTRLYNLQDCA